jgi:hypothetical protein
MPLLRASLNSRALPENRKAATKKRILASFFPDFRQIAPLLSSNHEKYVTKPLSLATCSILGEPP